MRSLQEIYYSGTRCARGLEVRCTTLRPGRCNNYATTNLFFANNVPIPQVRARLVGQFIDSSPGSGGTWCAPDAPKFIATLSPTEISAMMAPTPLPTVEPTRAPTAAPTLVPSPPPTVARHPYGPQNRFAACTQSPPGALQCSLNCNQLCSCFCCTDSPFTGRVLFTCGTAQSRARAWNAEHSCDFTQQYRATPASATAFGSCSNLTTCTTPVQAEATLTSDRVCATLPPTITPTSSPTNATFHPSAAPSVSTSAPTTSPTLNPTPTPTADPTAAPSIAPEESSTQAGESRGNGDLILIVAAVVGSVCCIALSAVICFAVYWREKHRGVRDDPIVVSFNRAFDAGNESGNSQQPTYDDDHNTPVMSSLQGSITAPSVKGLYDSLYESPSQTDHKYEEPSSAPAHDVGDDGYVKPAPSRESGHYAAARALPKAGEKVSDDGGYLHVAEAEEPGVFDFDSPTVHDAYSLAAGGASHEAAYGVVLTN